MKFLLCVLFLAAAASALSDLQYVEQEYKKLMTIISDAEKKYKEIPPPNAQLQLLNSNNILRFSGTLKKNFDSILSNAVTEFCSIHKNCVGSFIVRLGIAKTCLHSDIQASLQVELFDNSTSCLDHNLGLFINDLKVIENNWSILKDSKEKLMLEYADQKNRDEITILIDYHRYFIEKARDDLLKSLGEFKEAKQILMQNLNGCIKGGYPRISKEFYFLHSVNQCMENLLLKKLKVESEPAVVSTTTVSQEKSTIQSIPEEVSNAEDFSTSEKYNEENANEATYSNDY